MPYAIARKRYILNDIFTYEIVCVYENAEAPEDLLPDVYRYAKEWGVPVSDLIIVYSK